MQGSFNYFRWRMPSSDRHSRNDLDAVHTRGDPWRGGCHRKKLGPVPEDWGFFRDRPAARLHPLPHHIEILNMSFHCSGFCHCLIPSLLPRILHVTEGEAILVYRPLALEPSERNKCISGRIINLATVVSSEQYTIVSDHV